MPYIKEEIRRELNVALEHIFDIINNLPEGKKGAVNYVITRVVHETLVSNPYTYDTLSDAIAAFECAKLDLARRVMGPYEDIKLRENGEVYY